MKRLKEVVDKQRDEIRAKDRELGLKNEDVEAVSDQFTRLLHGPHRKAQSSIHKPMEGGLRYGSEVKSACCSSRGAWFDSRS